MAELAQHKQKAGSDPAFLFCKAMRPTLQDEQNKLI
jgi:hypothetical protein